MSHRKARLTVHGRRLLIERVQAGRPVPHVAAELGISRATGYKWVRRLREEGQKVAQVHTGPNPMKDSVDHLTVITPSAAPAVTHRQQRPQPLPLTISQTTPPHDLNDEPARIESPDRPNRF